MTYPRAHLVDTDNGGFYHCISRCVRRTWLCGVDACTGRSFEHRKEWVEARLLELTGLFAIELFGYVVMSNHYHVVVRVDPSTIDGWDDAEVARRWVRLTPCRTPSASQAAEAALLENEDRLGVIRKRLASLSWFMRFLNEPIARRANREDACSGRFWEGRFKSMALLDEAAVVACMAYVDLNPVRADSTQRIEDAQHTSIRLRLGEDAGRGRVLAPLGALNLALSEYRALLEWNAELSPGRREVDALSVVGRFGCSDLQWRTRVSSNRLKHRAYGSITRIRHYAEALGQRWLKGYSASHCWAPRPG